MNSVEQWKQNALMESEMRQQFQDENAWLRKALEPFAKAARSYALYLEDMADSKVYYAFKLSDLRQAHAALTGENG